MDIKRIRINKNRGWRGLAELVCENDKREEVSKMIFSFSEPVWRDMLKGHIVTQDKDNYIILQFDNTTELPAPTQQRSVLIKSFVATVTEQTVYPKSEWTAKAQGEHFALITHFIKNRNNHTTSDWNCIRSKSSTYNLIKGEIKMEIWKEIKGYEDKYLISNTGKVKSLSYNNTKKSKLLKPSIHNGYYSVCLWQNSKGKQHRVNRLVAEAFIPNPLNLPEVNHKDENKLNNQVENLEWCNSKYNCNYGNRNQKLSRPIQCIETKVIYPSILEAGKQTGINHTHLGDVARGKRKTAGGYHWKFIEI